MKIGIVGDGIVGGACKFGFQKLGHDVRVHDIKYEDSTLDLVKECELVFVCVPTPASITGECDIKIVESTVEALVLQNYRTGNVTQGIVIKSTVTPGTTSRLQNMYKGNTIAFVPEFLRERCAISDFVEQHDLLAIGSQDSELIQKVIIAHGTYPKKTVVLSPTEAEFLKYYSNVFNAVKIIFANEMYELCSKLGADYSKIKNAYIMRDMTKDIYLDVNSNFRGYGGMCLPKDVKAIAWLANKLDSKMNLFKIIDEENSKFKTTVYEGMRLK